MNLSVILAITFWIFYWSWLFLCTTLCRSCPSYSITGPSPSICISIELKICISSYWTKMRTSNEIIYGLSVILTITFWLFHWSIDWLTWGITTTISPACFVWIFWITLFTFIRLKFSISTPICWVIKTFSMFHHISNLSSSKRLTIISMYS